MGEKGQACAAVYVLREDQGKHLGTRTAGKSDRYEKLLLSLDIPLTPFGDQVLQFVPTFPDNIEIDLNQLALDYESRFAWDDPGRDPDSKPRFLHTFVSVMLRYTSPVPL